MIMFILFYLSIFVTTSCSGKSTKYLSQALTNKYYDIETRRINQNTTFRDIIVMRLTYNTIIAGGFILYPEAARVLSRCLRNRSRDLKLSSRYFKKSQHVRSKLKNKKTGTYGPFYFAQKQDQRLSYTFNGYYLDISESKKETKKNIKIYQTIDFSHATTIHKRPLNQRGVSTTLKLGNFSVSMSDTLIFTASKCQPFTAYATWKE